jgi:antitoxin component YwqK of YwqJK toxin-antitoxin module
VDGKRHGVERIYYESGALWSEAPFVKGKMHGVDKEYYESGALHWEAPYVNGNMHGVEKVYEEGTSNIAKLTLYKDGIEVVTLHRESEKATSAIPNIQGDHSDSD